MSTTRTDEQLDAARQDLVARAARIRSGDFAADPDAEQVLALRLRDIWRTSATTLLLNSEDASELSGRAIAG